MAKCRASTSAEKSFTRATFFIKYIKNEINVISIILDLFHSFAWPPKIYFKVKLNTSDQSDCEESDRVLDAQSDGVGILLLKKN